MGTEKKAYHIHSQLLSNKCPYFKGRADFQLKGQLDNQTPISFEDTICGVFDIFVEYIYTSAYTTSASLSTTQTSELHARLYYFADFLMMDDLKETALSKMQTILKKDMWSTQDDLTSQAIIQLLDIVYDNTIERHALQESSGKDGTGQDVKGNKSGTKKIDSASSLVESSTRPQSDPMRGLIARYAASQIQTLRSDENFDRLMADSRGIARDLLSFVRPASPL